jgi:hypothetical protein
VLVWTDPPAQALARTEELPADVGGTDELARCWWDEG